MRLQSGPGHPAVNEDMRVRRCAVLMVEPRESLDLDLAGLFAGAEPLRASVRWWALAPHLDDEVEIDEQELIALGRIGETPWRSISSLDDVVPRSVLEQLLRKGLLVSENGTHDRWRARDETLRQGHWRPLSAVAHYFSRWSGAGVGEDVRITRHRSLTDLVSEYGAPPAHLTAHVTVDRRVPLPPASTSDLDELFRRRATCRNFDMQSVLGAKPFSDLLQRVLGCHDQVEVIPGAIGLKKANPSGGGLHPLEAYLLLRDVDGHAPGLYHYHVGDHALEPMTPLDADAVHAMASTFVAGQDFFADAHVHMILTARFRRTFWKYRNHPKAYRAIVLEVGHVSQNLYLAATELGLAAYVTAAINEVDIERALGINALQESPIAVCGFGLRAGKLGMLEFDPLHEVWDKDGSRR